jgi:hypothetical protein
VASMATVRREREMAAEKAIVRCPTCREPIGEEVAEVGAQVGRAPTFVMQQQQPQAASSAPLQQSSSHVAAEAGTDWALVGQRAGSRAGRGGRGGRARGARGSGSGSGGRPHG